MAARIQLDGATALVTGAGAGIGRSSALALAGRGSRVLVADVDGPSAEKVAAEVEERGGRAEAHVLDVADADAVASLAARADPVDVVVANAGVGMSAPLADMALDDWRWIRSINLDGVLHTCHAFGPPMLDRGRGHLVIVSSGLGYLPTATEPAYCTTKAAVLQLAQCLRADWARRGVGVSAICPGVIDTGIIERSRFLGDAVDADAARRVFARGHAPARVAADVVRAVERDRAVLASGWEAKVGWLVHRLAPLRLQQRFARADLR